jgi:hypothetical protein
VALIHPAPPIVTSSKGRVLARTLKEGQTVDATMAGQSFEMIEVTFRQITAGTGQFASERLYSGLLALMEPDADKLAG